MDKFLDPVNSYYKLKLKIVKGDGSNYILATLFNQVDVSFGGTIISTSSNTYAYQAILETLLNYGEEAKSTQLGMGLFSKDTSKHMDEN